MSDDDLDQICAAYLSQLRDSLRHIPATEREQIIEQVAEHIASARAALPEQSEAEVRNILERLGSPQEIASTAEADQVPPTSRRRQRIAVLVAAAALALVGIAVGLVYGLSGTTGPNQYGGTASRVTTTTSHARDIDVPTVVGETFPAAIQALTASQLGYSVVYDASSQPPGTVLRQVPDGGANVPTSAKVALTVSGTQVATAVPDVIGQSQAQAQASLTAAGLDVTVTTQPSPASPGLVIRQSPAAGSRVAPHSVVMVDVSAG